MSSSSNFECWPFILEKSLAKFVGSYGEIASLAQRPDAVEMALRWLTGGHVFKCQTSQFDWQSVAEEVVGVNGVEYITNLLAEGALVAVGRSDQSMYYYRGKKMKRLQELNCNIPYGRLFPILRLENRKGFFFLSCGMPGVEVLP